MRKILGGNTLMQLASLLAAIGWLGCGATAWAETITGTFRYADFNPANNTTELRPIQFCRVQIHALYPFPFSFWHLELTTTTDANGSISVQHTLARGTQYKVVVFAENYAASVVKNDLLATGPFWQEPGFPDGAAFIRTVNSANDVLVFSYDFTDPYTPQHWNLADAVRHGFDYVAARRDPSETDPLPVAAVHPGYYAPTFYSPNNRTLEVNNRDLFEDLTVLHEYGHFVQHHIGRLEFVPSVHNNCTATNAALAWMEGFANFFAQAVATNSPPGTVGGRDGIFFDTSSVSELEHTPWSWCFGQPPNAPPNTIMNVVAGVLWDLFDPEGDCYDYDEALDGLAGWDAQIIQILDHELGNLQRGPSIDDFSAAWFARGLPAEPYRDILRQHGFLPPRAEPTLTCPGDITVTASAGADCSTAVTFPAPTLDQNLRCGRVWYWPPSGSTFTVGTTTVYCYYTFQDDAGNSEIECSFRVTVQPSSTLPNPNGTGLLGVYYDNVDFTSPRVARTEAVNFEWGMAAPAPGVDADTFSVRWTGKLVPRYSDLYEIETFSDDGVRLWIDGRQIINQWNDHGPTRHSGKVSLEAGQSHDVVLEMYENGGGATAKLRWWSDCQKYEPIPASHLLPARLECPPPERPTFSVNFVNGIPLVGVAVFGQATLDDGWLKLTKPNTAFGIFHIRNFSGAQPVHGFEARFTTALFGSTCCDGGAMPADGFSFNLVPAASVLANPGYNQPGEEGLDTGLAVNFDTYDNGGNEGPAVEVKWLGQLIARQPFQVSQSPAGLTSARAAAREVLINLTSDGRLSVTYGGIRLLVNVQTPYSPTVIGTPEWVIGARNGGANDNHWIRDLQIVVNRASISGLFNTGVDELRRPLTDNASDPHYVLSVASGLPTTPWVAAAAGGFPIGPWLPDNIASAWIAPTANTFAPNDLNISYETTFNLKGLDPASAVIHGWVAADNQLVNILLNGQSTSQATPVAALGGEPYTTWQAFAITSGFQPGPNTLTFVTRNGTGGSNPTGLRVEMCGWATSPPQLQLGISYGPRSAILRWGSLPHKRYFIEHTDHLAGSWIRESVEPVSSGAYETQISEPLLPSRDPIRFYRVVEAP